MLIQPTSGSRLFSIAVISDTHLNSVEDDANTVFPVNRHANSRLRMVVEDLNRRDIERVFHLGDVVHPVPSAGEVYKQASQRFFEQVKQLNHPLHVIPGNHDVGDKSLPWGPAGTIRQSFVEAYSACFGEHYFATRQQGIVFIGINAQLFGSGLELEAEQMQWLESKLAESEEDRIFMFSHYPPYLLDVDEMEHYDNFSIKSRRVFLSLLRDFNVEALFAGHVHHFWFNRYKQCNIYMLPSTAFTRQDYSEMFRISPSTEFGRNDPPKLGYLLIHIYQKGHEFEFIRCADSKTGSGGQDRRRSQEIKQLWPRSETRPVLGIELRDDWQDLVCIPPSGALDEFDRKTVRNDYPLLALWEMGVQQLKITVSDLLNDRRRTRLADLMQMGFKFTLYSFEPSEREILKRIISHAHLIESWELAGEPEICFAQIKEIRSIAAAKHILLFYSPIRRKADVMRQGKKYYHVINHGFSVEDFNDDSDIDIKNIAKYCDGIVIQSGLNDQIETVFDLAHDIKHGTGVNICVQLRLRADDPSLNQRDEQMLCNRIAEAMILAWFNTDCRLFCDTLADVDRGYFPRIGLVDRLYNPRIAALIVRHLHRLQDALGEPHRLVTDNIPRQNRLITCEAQFGTLVMEIDSGGAESNHACKDKPGLWLNWNNGTLTPKKPGHKGLPFVRVLGYEDKEISHSA